MANLIVLPGGRGPKPFSMSSRGVAKFMLASPYAARKVVESYAFPKVDRARKMLPAPAKDIVWNYFRTGRDRTALERAIALHEVIPEVENGFEKGRRRQALSVAQHLLNLDPRIDLHDVCRARDMRMPIAGLPVRASLDFLCRTLDDKVSVVIVNVAAEVSDHKDDLDHYALIESEIAWQITRVAMPEVEQILYLDAASEKIVRTHVKSYKGAWRNVETTCDNIIIAYRIPLARRERARRSEG